jgi:hypothetical protein
MNLSATGITVLILILHLILGPRNDPGPSKKTTLHRSGPIGSGIELRGLHFASLQMIPCGSILRALMRKGKLWQWNWKAKLGS